MCREETMMRMSAIEGKILEMLEVESMKGLENADAAELGEVIDMLKDLAEAKYYCSVVMAMDQGSDTMGYNSRRYSDGRYAPKGRGTMGYEPMMMDEPMGYGMGYDGSQGRSNGSMGYTGGNGQSGSQNGSQGRSMGYGTAYDRYQQARMGYQQSRTAENRRGMDEAANEHVREFTDTMTEMWQDADQSQRNQMRNALVKFVNDLK